MALPDFLVAGVAKAGTTALYAALVAAPAALPAHRQGAQVLPDRRPAAGHGRPGRRADLPGARLAASRLRGAVRPGAGGHAARRGHAVLPVRAVARTGGSTARPRRAAHPDAPRPGRPGPFQLGAPVVGGAGAGGRLPRGLRARAGAPGRRLGGLLALPRPGPLRRAARPPLRACSRASRCWCCATGTCATSPVAHLDRVCGFLGVAHRPADRRPAGERHLVRRRHAGERRPARGRCASAARSATGSRCRSARRSAARC